MKKRKLGDPGPFGGLPPKCATCRGFCGVVRRSWWTSRHSGVTFEFDSAPGLVYCSTICAWTKWQSLMARYPEHFTEFQRALTYEEFRSHTSGSPEHPPLFRQDDFDPPWR